MVKITITHVKQRGAEFISCCMNNKDKQQKTTKIYGLRTTDVDWKQKSLQAFHRCIFRISQTSTHNSVTKPAAFNEYLDYYLKYYYFLIMLSISYIVQTDSERQRDSKTAQAVTER